MSHGEPTPDGGRVSTGIEGLDVLLHGGLVRGGVFMVMGRPGTGKTTIGNQLCFSHVKRGGRAAYVTLLTESHARMLASLQGMRFFDPEPIGRELVYYGAYSVLRESKLHGLLTLVRTIIRDHRASVLVLDGLATASSMATSHVEVKEFVAELQALSAMVDCTTLVLANVSGDEARGPEHSMVDGLFELTLQQRSARPVREIEILKFRGSSHFLGAHDLEITDAGVVVRPRTEELIARWVPGAPSSDRVRVGTGVEQLDEMLGGGLLSGSTTMLLGFSGSGKTSIAMHALAAAAGRGEAGVYLGFYESPERLIEGARSIGIDLAPAVERGALGIVWQPPLRCGLDQLAERLFEEVRNRSAKLVVIDGLDGFRQAAPSSERAIRFVSAVLTMLRSLDVTAILTEETMKVFGPEVEVRVSGMSALVDNIVLTEYVDVGTQLRRLVSVLKLRASSHDMQVREMTIGRSGVSVAPDSTSAEEIIEASRAHGSGRRSRGGRSRRRSGDG